MDHLFILLIYFIIVSYKIKDWLTFFIIVYCLFSI